MFDSENFFLSPRDSASEQLAKLVRVNRAMLGQDGTVAVADTSAVTPSLNQAAFAVVEADGATVIETLEGIDPVTGEFTVQEAVELVSGQRLVGFFTYIKLTSGAVTLYPIAADGETPAVPALSAALLTNGSVKLTVSRASGGLNPPNIGIHRLIGSSEEMIGSLTDAGGGKAVYTDTTPGSPGDILKYKVRYEEPYESGVTLGRAGAYSNEVTLTEDDRTDALLDSLVIADAADAPLTFDPVFDPAVITYATTIADGSAGIHITPTVNQPGATIQVKVGAGPYAALTSGVTLGVPAINVPVGDTVILVKVTAQDGTTTKIYSTTLTRQSQDATLSALSIVEGLSQLGDISPTFDPAVITYTTTIADGSAGAGLTATVNQPGATVEVKVGSAAYAAQASGVALAIAAGSVPVGDTVILVRVTAEDGVTTKVYTTTVTVSA